jgi:hypothetical protein
MARSEPDLSANHQLRAFNVGDPLLAFHEGLAAPNDRFAHAVRKPLRAPALFSSAFGAASPLRCRAGFRAPFRLRSGTLRQLLAARFTIPLLERFVRNLAVHKELRELPPLCLALERHGVLSADLLAFNLGDFDAIQVSTSWSKSDAIFTISVASLSLATWARV